MEVHRPRGVSYEGRMLSSMIRGSVAETSFNSVIVVFSPRSDFFADDGSWSANRLFVCGVTVACTAECAVALGPPAIAIGTCRPG